MGNEALSLEKGSTGASQTQLLPLAPLRAEPLPLKVLQHLPPVAHGFPQTAAMSRQPVKFCGLGRESMRASVKLFLP